ncbi:MAG: nitrate reductase molybdenum cofactor assembly chaperone [Rhodobacteraceae bacterium]|nr:nitrate reductase molybdenum cofactor assembly chaperone [Paracoccaceae bacterium]
MIRTYKALSALLTYPSVDLLAASSEIAEVFAEEAILPEQTQRALRPLLQDLSTGDLYGLQERYVLLFDRSRTLSLNLFEHVHGESRERGPAMVDLLETYRAGGYDLAATELPDHLPVLLEFLSTRSDAEARELLADAGHILAALAERLARRESVYAPVLAALAELGGVAKTSEAVQELLTVADDDPEDLEALDAVWQEAEVTFGPDPNAGCPVTRDMLARMDPVPPKPQAADAAGGMI